MFKKSILAFALSSLLSNVALAASTSVVLIKNHQDLTDQSNSSPTQAQSQVQDDNSWLGLGTLIGAGALLAAAAGGGGGGGGGSTSSAPPANTTPTPAPTIPAPTPNPAYVYTADYANSSNYLMGSGAYTAHSEGFLGAGATVGVIDSGISTHAEFGARRQAGQNFADSGQPTLTTDTSPFHGSHVTGIIASAADGVGNVGVAPQANVVPLRVFDSSGNGNTAYVTNALNYAAVNSIPIINMSLGFASANSAVSNAMIAYAQSGGMGAIAAGNASAANPDYPASSIPDAMINGQYTFIAVGAGNYDSNGVFQGLASFSNQAGSAMNYYLVAPGVNIYSTLDTGTYGYKSGTSMASPVVAGAMALIKGKWPQMTNVQVVQLLLNTATDVGAPGPDPIYGRGLLNIQNAITPQGASVTSVNGQSVPLTQAFKGIGSALPASISAQGQVVFTDSYGRDFTTDAKNLFRGAQVVRTEQTQSLSSTVYAAKPSARLLFAYQDQSSVQNAFSATNAFPFALQSSDLKQIRSIAYDLGNETQIGMAIADRFNAANLQTDVSGLTLGFALAKQDCTTGALNCSNDNQTFSLAKSWGSSSIKGFYSVQSLNQSGTLAKLQANLIGYGLQASTNLGDQWSAGFKVEQRPFLRSGQVSGVAVGYDQIAQRFIEGNVGLQSGARPLYVEAALVNKLSENTLVKYSLEAQSNYNGLNQNNVAAMGRLSYQF